MNLDLRQALGVVPQGNDWFRQRKERGSKTEGGHLDPSRRGDLRAELVNNPFGRWEKRLKKSCARAGTWGAATWSCWSLEGPQQVEGTG